MERGEYGWRNGTLGYWRAIGFAEVKQAADEFVYLRVCSPKPDWDDDVVDVLAGSTDVSKENRGGVYALGAVARRDLTAGKSLREPTREEAAAHRREAERELHANRRGGGKGRGKGSNTGKGKGEPTRAQAAAAQRSKAERESHAYRHARGKGKGKGNNAADGPGKGKGKGKGRGGRSWQG